MKFYWYKDVYTDSNILSEKLRLIGALLPDPLEERVNIREYAQKLYEHADICCASDGINENIVGLLAIYANDTVSFSSFISFVGVLQSYQGKKVGSALLEQAINLAESRKMKSIFLRVHKSNTSALNFYSKFGFIAESEQENKWILRRVFEI